MKFSVKFDGQLVRQGLQDLRAEIPQIGRQGVRTVMERIKRRMQEYPPEPAGQSIEISVPVLGRAYTQAKGRYRRTGKLGASWTITEIASSTNGGYVIENNASNKGKLYGQYVVGDAFGTKQAWMHRGRWQLLRDISEEELEKLPAEVEAQLMIVSRRVGL